MWIIHVDNTSIYPVPHGCQPAHVFQRQRCWWTWGDPILSTKTDQERLLEGNTGGFRLCVPFKLELLGGKPIDGVTLPVQTWTVHKQLYKPRQTAGFCLFPSKHEVESVTFSSSHLRDLFGKDRGRFKKRKVPPMLALGNPTEWQGAVLQQLLCLKCKMWMCLEEVSASITVCKYCLWRRASPVSHSSLP